MSFERFRATLACQQFVNCHSPATWHNYKLQFSELELSVAQSYSLKDALSKDAEDLYFKGCLSLSEAIASLHSSRFSWAIVQLYYSIFYYLRSSLAVRGYAIVRNKSLFCLKARSGEQPSKHNNNDHEGVINLYKSLFRNSDRLQGNRIEGVSGYDWMMTLRNQVHYKERLFHEPRIPSWLEIIGKFAKNGQIDSLVDRYIEDESLIYCFQPEHAALAIPVRRAILTRRELVNDGRQTVFDIDRATMLASLLNGPNGANSRCAHLVL
jgi:uncharacterized protein (UPF0332 family)